MKEIPYVGKEVAQAAREIEERFLKLSPESGVIFVSVTAKPGPKGKNVGFEVKLGVSKNLSEDVGWTLIQYVLKDEIALRLFDITGSVHTGFSGACRDTGPKDAGSIKNQAHDSV